MRPFPGPAGQWRVSTGGGSYPRWSATARELLYLGQNTLVFAPCAVVGDSPYDLHPDGKRLAVAAAQDQDVVQDKVVFMFNVFDYLRTIAPVKK